MSKLLLSFGRWQRLRNKRPAATSDPAGTPAPQPRATSSNATNPANGRELSNKDQSLPWDWLFNASAEAVLIIDAASELIVEANPAAAKLLGTDCAALVESPLLAAFDSGCAQGLGGSLAKARTEGRAESKGVRTCCGTDLNMTISLFQANTGSYLLVHVAANVNAESECEGGFEPSAAFHAIEDASLGFLVADSSFRVEYANRGFLKLVKLNSLLSVKGTPLVRWLGLSAAQLASLSEQLWSRTAIRDLMTTLRTAHEAPRAVAVSAVAVPDGQSTLWGFCVREVARLH